MLKACLAVQYISRFSRHVLPKGGGSVAVSAVMPLILTLIERNNEPLIAAKDIGYFELTSFHLSVVPPIWVFL